MSDHETLVKVSDEMLEDARKRHAWLIAVVEQADQEAQRCPFFVKLREESNEADRREMLEAKDFEDLRRRRRPQVLEAFRWTRELFHHSRTLVRFIATAMANEREDDNMMRFYAGHLWEEAPHSSWLARWMVEHEIAESEEEVRDSKPGQATAACIDYGRRLAEEYDRDAWLVGVNCGVEKCSHTFFSFIEPILDRYGLSDEYFRVHVVADVYHSTEALAFVPTLEPNSKRAQYLRDILLEGISLWYGMLNSWVGTNLAPCFGLDGSMQLEV